MKYNLKSKLSTLILLVALTGMKFTYLADTQGGQHAVDHDHGDPLELHTVMRLLMQNLHTINEGIFNQDFDIIEAGAASIYDHPSLADESMNLLEETLGGRMAQFEELDHFVHIRADSIREAAANQNMSKVLEQYQITTQACINCHAAFQDEIRRARLQD